MIVSELRSRALQLLSLCDPSEKGLAVIALREQYLQGEIAINREEPLTEQGFDIPGRPPSPILVNPGLVKRRSMVDAL